MSGNKWLSFDNIDTWMFRDGRPFNQNDAGAAVAASVFPPFPPTLVGAVRALLWRHVLGGTWDGRKLGDGTNWQNSSTLGPLQFGPPLVLRDGKPVFPAPLHLVEGKDEQTKKKRLTFLWPGKNGVKCDLDDNVCLPEPAEALEGIETITDRWVTLAGMKTILDGCLPEKTHLVPVKDLWQMESRVGIGINPETRVVREAELYMASHVRPCDNVRLAVEMQGWEGELPKGLTPLAGEHRMAGVQQVENPGLPELATPEDGCIVLIAISPVAPDDKGNIAGLPEDKLVSACTGKPVPIGGWDSQGKKAIPLRHCWPAGSVWFLENFKGTPPASIGAATEWGFGRVLAAAWPS